MHGDAFEALVLPGMVIAAGCLGTTAPKASETPAKSATTMGVSDDASYLVFENTEVNTTYEVTVTVARAPVSAYDITYEHNGTLVTETFEGIPPNVTHETVVEPNGSVVASETYTVGVESSIVVRLDGMPDDATLMSTYRAKGVQFLRDVSGATGCRGELRSYTAISSKSTRTDMCGTFSDELYENGTTYYTLRPNETD